jgi:hypothetical protein
MRRGDPTRRVRASDGYEPIVPLGPGLTTRRLRLTSDEAIRDLGLALSGYDGLASIHGDGVRTVCIVTTDSLAAELDALLDEIRATIPFDVIG